MRDFSAIAALVKKARLAQGYSQTDLARLLKYKNGQFISNVERGKCSIPVKSGLKLCEVLKISRDDLSFALAEDYSSYVCSVLYPEENSVVRSLL